MLNKNILHSLGQNYSFELNFEARGGAISAVVNSFWLCYYGIILFLNKFNLKFFQVRQVTV